MFSLESPHRGDSNEYTQYTIFIIEKKITLDYPKSAAMGFFPRDSRMSPKQPWFKPLKFYCTIFTGASQRILRASHALRLLHVMSYVLNQSV